MEHRGRTVHVRRINRHGILWYVNTHGRAPRLLGALPPVSVTTIYHHRILGVTPCTRSLLLACLLQASTLDLALLEMLIVTETQRWQESRLTDLAASTKPSWTLGSLHSSSSTSRPTSPIPTTTLATQLICCCCKQTMLSLGSQVGVLASTTSVTSRRQDTGRRRHKAPPVSALRSTTLSSTFSTTAWWELAFQLDHQLC